MKYSGGANIKEWYLTVYLVNLSKSVVRGGGEDEEDSLL